MFKRKDRPLTQILQAEGDRLDPNHGIKRKELLARRMWDLATTGQVSFEDGRELKASVRDWRETASWIYQQCDGPHRADDGTDTLGSALAGMTTQQLRDRLSETMAGLATQAAAEDTDSEGDSPAD